MSNIRLKHIVEYQKGRVPKKYSKDAKNQPYLSMEYLRGKREDIVYVEEDEKNIYVEKGDVLVLWDGANAGEIIKATRGCLSSTMAVLKPNKKYVHKDFFYYFLKSKEIYFKDMANGTTIPHLDQDSFFGEHFKILPKNQQTAIAHYLDAKTAKINTFIKNKTRLIALLKEQRQAIINDLVSGKRVLVDGELQKPTQTKDSGIEWLGAIPEDWEVKRLKFLGYLYAGLSGKSGNDFSNEKKINKYYIPFTNVANNTFINPEQLEKVYIGENENQNRVLKGDLLFLMSSETPDDIGKSALLNDDIEEIYLNSFCRALRITSNLIDSQYLVFLLNSKAYRDKLSIEGKGFTRINLKKYNLMNLYLLIPPLKEQTQIVSYLKTKTAQIDHAIAKAQKEIALIKEYKEAMISEAVVGKLNINK